MFVDTVASALLEIDRLPHDRRTTQSIGEFLKQYGELRSRDVSPEQGKEYRKLTQHLFSHLGDGRRGRGGIAVFVEAVAASLAEIDEVPQEERTTQRALEQLRKSVDLRSGDVPPRERKGYGRLAHDLFNHASSGQLNDLMKDLESH